MKDLFQIAFYLFAIYAWLYALISDIANSNIAWALVDFFIFPIGLIRGIILML